jgi:hypothetical protein
MPREHKSKCDKSSKNKSTESESSYESVSSEEVKVFLKHRHNKEKHHEHKDNHEHKEKHHEHKEKCRESESDSETNSDTSCSDKKKYCFEDIYKYYKYRLVSDDKLMIAGSNAYINSYNNTLQNIPAGYPVTFSNNDLKYNIDHPSFNAPFVVRESGIYIVFFIASVDQAAQFTLFINGNVQLLTTTGNNAGGGQTVFRSMVSLNKDDTLIMRNYISSANSLTAQLNIGGTQIGNNLTFLLLKIAALPCGEYQKICDTWKPECLSKRKAYLFKKILEKMLMDKELMLKGFNVHGTFYSQISQDIATESNVIWNNYLNVNGLNWTSTNSDQIQILEDGVYKVFFVGTTNTACQFSICINDLPIDSSTQGTNKGAGQTSLRTLLELKKGDYITVKNHSSTTTTGNLTISVNAGGIHPTLSVLCTVFKIAPLIKPDIKYCKLDNYHKKCFEKFRCFLLSNKCLQLTGSPAYVNSFSSNSQNLKINDSFNFEYDTLKQEIYHSHGTSEYIIQKDGIYDIFVDLITNESAQITLFVNGAPDLTTTSGRDSGANRTLLRQFIKLCKGDCINVRNYESNIGTLTSALNTGGNLPGHPAFFMIFLLSPIDDDNCLKSKKCK